MVVALLVVTTQIDSTRCQRSPGGLGQLWGGGIGVRGWVQGAKLPLVDDLWVNQNEQNKWLALNGVDLPSILREQINLVLLASVNFKVEEDLSIIPML